MAFCGNCGTNFQDGVKFCPSCGQVVENRTSDAEANKAMAVIGYIGILILVPLIKGGYKESPFLNFHINQAISFMITYLVVMLVGIIPFIGFYLSMILLLGVMALHISSIISALRCETKTLPIISSIKFIK